MRNVTRSQEPASFRRVAHQWTQVLLKKIETEGKASDYYFARYNHKSARDIRRNLEDTLLAMYNEMCCYCEGRTPRVQGEIEHLKPKKKFPDLTYDWNNLHWICVACNGIKLEQYDDINPILDPSGQGLITDHIEVSADQDLQEIWFLSINNSQRGQTTIDHTGLNRDDLRYARFHIFWKTVALIAITRNPNVNLEIVKMTKTKLKKLYIGEHGFVTTVKAAFVTTALRYEDL